MQQCTRTGNGGRMYRGLVFGRNLASCLLLPSKHRPPFLVELVAEVHELLSQFGVLLGDLLARLGEVEVLCREVLNLLVQHLHSSLLPLSTGFRRLSVTLL